MDEYTILEKLGEGGMGQVFRARQTHLRREVALKTIHPELAQHVESMQRFRREVKLLCTISHPNIVPVFDGGVFAGRPYFVMELIEGVSLDQRVRQDGPIPVLEATRLLRDAADALAFLHERGIQHRDIKPRNLILTGEEGNGRLVLVDFGLARTEASRHLTKAGEVVGTLAYLAPEALEHSAGASQDVWALGVTAYEMVAGKTLFEGRDPGAILTGIASFKPAELEYRIPDVPAWFRNILGSCLEVRPEDRVTARDLRQLCDDGPEGRQSSRLVAAGSDMPATKRVRWPGWRRWTLATLGVGGLIGAASLAGLVPGPGASTPGRIPSSGPSVAVTEVTPSLPRDLLCLASERSVLVDFTLAHPSDLLVAVAPVGGKKAAASHRRPPDRQTFHEVFRGLEPDTLHELTVIDAAGRAIIRGHPIRTRDLDHGDRRRQALARMKTPGFREMVVEHLVEFPEPELITPLESILAAGPLADLPMHRLSHVAGALREPRLLRRMLDYLPLADQDGRIGIMEAAADSRSNAAADLARQWLDTVADVHEFNACARVLGAEGRADSCGRIAARIEAEPGWWLVSSVEAMIACDREAARTHFKRWLGIADLALAGVCGLGRLGEDRDLRHLLDVVDSSPAGWLDPAIAPVLADRSPPWLPDALRHRLAKRPTPPWIWAAARAGVQVTSVTGGAGPAFSGTGDERSQLARDSSLAFVGEPGPELIASAREVAGGAPGWRRDLATWLLSVWRDPGSIPLLAGRAFSPESDPEGLALWTLGRLGDAGLPAPQLDQVLVEVGPGCRSLLLRQAIGLLAVHRRDPVRARPVLEQLQEDRTARHPIRSLALRLFEQERSLPRTRLQDYVTLVTYQPAGIHLEPGRSLHVRGWGLHPDPERPGEWSPFPDRPDHLYPGPNGGMLLRRGPDEWIVRSGWSSFLADEPAELLITPITRLQRDDEQPLGKLYPSLILLEMLD